MTKKILLECLKKSKWAIFFSVVFLIYIYGKIDSTVFVFFIFNQIWLIKLSLDNAWQNDLNTATNDFVNAASDKIVAIYNNLDELKKIYQELVDYFGPDKDK